MKKFLCLLICLTCLLSACDEKIDTVSDNSEKSESSVTSDTDISSENSSSSTTSEDKVEDTNAPTIRIIKDQQKVIINKGDEYDLMSGVIGNDDVDGDITHKIQINKGGYDSAVPGEYMVTYFLSDDAGNSAEPKFKQITVRETETLSSLPVWEGSITGEVLNPKNPAVFGGAWYHKVVSSKDKWVGIEVTVTLPEVDIERYNGAYNSDLGADPNAKNLDNPSVYLGGNAISESDVGLSFSRALVNVKTETLSTGSIAFRPFWRYITEEDKDVGGYDAHGGEYAVSANGNNCIANYHWRYTEYYYLPGDTLRIIVHIPEENKMQLQIEVIEKSSLPESVAIRAKYGWKDPADFISPVFASPGHGTGMDAEFKRVNAIDQSGNEGGIAIPTQTEIKNIIWHETYLYRYIDGVLYRVPMSEERRGTTSAPESKYFTVSYDGVNSALGGEVVTIHPAYEN